MFWLTVLGKGVLIGLAMAAPMGPAGVLCLRRTLERGRLAGFIAGLGAALADGLYGVITAFGISQLSDWLLGATNWLRPAGGIFLLLMGGYALASPHLRKSRVNEKNGWLGGFSMCLVLTASNPLIFMGMSAMFLALGLAGDLGHVPISVGLAVIGVFSGSAIWFAILCLLAGQFTKAMNLNKLNKATGAALGPMGAVVLWQSLG